ncbi:MAG: guanylate kinase [Desulfuromonadaceae bacterium]|nr:guanylate kinase [Desulfuromonadaceae bacterium]
MAAVREGILLVVSAPSGAGKTTLCRRLIDIFPDLYHSVSFTTRPRREGEQDGVDYHFVDVAAFCQMIEQNAFVEWAQVHDNYYGTARQTLDEARQSGRDLLLEIDVQGAAQLKKQQVTGAYVFIAPPSLTELEKRLRLRNTDSDEVIRRRIANARGELEQAAWYDYLIVNDHLEEAALALQGIVRAQRCRTSLVLSRHQAAWLTR